MTDVSEIEPTPPRRGPGATPIILGVGVVLLIGAGLAFTLLRTPPSPPPADVASDPLLLAGRTTYLDRCVSCHGASGKGDGPISKTFKDPPVGDLTDGRWRYGDRPEQVEAVIAGGASRGTMPAWGKTLGPDGVREVSAYVFYLAGREVPESFRESPPKLAQ